jgi:hypothetical protein
MGLLYLYLYLLPFTFSPTPNAHHFQYHDQTTGGERAKLGCPLFKEHSVGESPSCYHAEAVSVLL